MKAVYLLALTAFVAVPLACATTASTIRDPDTGDAGAVDAARDVKPDSTKQEEEEEKEGKPDAKTEPPPNNDPPCKNTTTQVKCSTCCADEHPSGSAIYLQALVNCLCVADKCLADCESTGCMGQAPDATCQACVSANAASCQTELINSCMPVQACADFITCGTNAGCLNKP
jgi:hypothetical protein